MEKHSCKLCFRSFANGRALGGHMRSHVAASTKAAAQLIKDSPSSSSSMPSYSSSRDDDDDDDEAKLSVSGLGYVLRENPKKSFRLVDPEFSSSTFAAAAVAVGGGSSIVVQDHESETESSLAPSATIQRRRSKRARRAPLPDPHPEPEPVSSVSDTTPEEDVAISLMILSRDIWTPPPPVSSKSQREYSENFDFLGDEKDGDHQINRKEQHKGRSKYQCGACKKVFKSYQALGGHRASHKKTNGCVPQAPAPAAQIHEMVESSVNAAERVHHECPVCYRVFSSGQALGGHKRSHLTSSSSAAAAAAITVASNSMASASAAAASPMSSATGNGNKKKCVESLIDLNLPAPMDDDAELSAVSDAEFVMGRCSN